MTADQVHCGSRVIVFVFESLEINDVRCDDPNVASVFRQRQNEGFHLIHIEKRRQRLTRNGARRGGAALSASPCWSLGPPRGICYFRPNICSLLPFEAKPR